MKYSTLEISPLKLSLDYKNPRFIIPPNPSEDQIIEYLLEFEEILDLANSINELGSLMFGERVIVCKEDNKYVVLEGNRRICSCKLLLNNKLIPEKFKNKINSIKKETKSNIDKIEVDVVESREIAQSSLASKHIEGVKRWSTFSKNKFFTNEFDSGKTIDYIAKITSVTKSKVITGIIQNKLLNYAFNLSIWSKEEREKYLNPQTIKPSPYFRVFSTESKVIKGSRARDIIKLNYNNVTYEPMSALPKEIFDHCIYLIAKAAFIDDNFNTRNIIDDVPEFVDYISKFYSNSILKPNEKFILVENNVTNNDENNNQQEKYTNNKIDTKEEKEQNDEVNKLKSERESKIGKELKATITAESKVDLKENTNSDENLTNKDENTNLKGHRPTLGNFFENLTWSTVNTSNDDNRGVINIATEIVAISKNNNYKKFPISATILMRTLLENVSIYYLKKLGLYDKFAGGFNGKTPPLEKIIEYYKKATTTIFKGDKNFERTFSSFADSKGTKDYLDMVIHNPHLVQAAPGILDNIAQCGLKGFIQTILNK
jgi:hypothetical protein